MGAGLLWQQYLLIKVKQYTPREGDDQPEGRSRFVGVYGSEGLELAGLTEHPVYLSLSLYPTG